ncbi:hypothetical protein [Streptomyces sp. NPDC057694]|uniref:hypothetical protein n=1 Tax=Streptomyces sp. NPDC057694 TaxID=3346216 RepID=UPI0036AEB0AB
MLSEAELEGQSVGLLPSREALGVLKFHCGTPVRHSVGCLPQPPHHGPPAHHEPVHHQPVHHGEPGRR